MNERIRELAEQAGISYLSSVHPDMWEKFAELIVRECMSMSDNLKAEYLKDRKAEMDFGVKNNYAEGEAACTTLKYRMKKHFGVEE